jgi:hypothetical protein
MYSVVGDTTSLVPGFPIRTSSDQRSVDSSPRHNAASHVLHRLPVPRHPPCALKHLQTQNTKNNSRKNQNCIITHTNNTHPHKKEPAPLVCEMLATTIHKSNTTPHHQSRATTTNPEPYPGRGPPPNGGESQPTSGIPGSGRRDSGPVVSKPNSVSGNSITAKSSQRLNPVADQRLLCTRPPPTTGERAIHRIAWFTEPPHNVGGTRSRGAP